VLRTDRPFLERQIDNGVVLDLVVGLTWNFVKDLDSVRQRREDTNLRAGDGALIPVVAFVVDKQLGDGSNARCFMMCAPSRGSTAFVISISISHSMKPFNHGRKR